MQLSLGGKRVSSRGAVEADSPLQKRNTQTSRSVDGGIIRII